MIINLKNGRRVFIAGGSLEAIVPIDSEKGGYTLQVGGREFDVNREAGEAILDVVEKREGEARKVKEESMAELNMALIALRQGSQPHDHDPVTGNCIPPPPARKSADWLADLDDDGQDRPASGEGN